MFALPGLHLLLLLIATVATTSNPSGEASPFPKSSQPTTYLYTISEEHRSPVELLALDSLSGWLARETPQLYRVSTTNWRNGSDSYSQWLSTMEKNGVTVNDSLLSSTLGTIVQHFISAPPSFLRCNATNTSVSVAITLAAASNSLLLIAGDSATSRAFEAINATLVHDVRSAQVDAVITSHLLHTMSTSVFVFQDPSKSQFLADWAIYARASTMPWNASSRAQHLTLARVTERGAAFGWGPENDYVTTLNQHGVWVHASDYNKNFPALSNVVPTYPTYPTAAAAAPSQLPTAPRPTTTRHTVSFMMTDGDNLQWTLGPWATSQQWYGNSKRGSFPMGWTVSPSIADLAPSAMAHILSVQTANDELIAGPSGYGYMYPTTLPTSNVSLFAALTNRAMQSFQMTTMNVLGQNDNGKKRKNVCGVVHGVSFFFFSKSNSIVVICYRLCPHSTQL